MSLIWNDYARLEFIEAAGRYGHIDFDLGERFVNAIEAAVARLRASPQTPRKFDGEARKVRLERFPYAVIYQMEGQDIHIIAVMHLHREPGYWHGRLG
jgi:plasmid stabilization system protein ParE